MRVFNFKVMLRFNQLKNIDKQKIMAFLLRINIEGETLERKDYIRIQSLVVFMSERRFFGEISRRCCALAGTIVLHLPGIVVKELINMLVISLVLLDVLVDSGYGTVSSTGNIELAVNVPTLLIALDYPIYYIKTFINLKRPIQIKES